MRGFLATAIFALLTVLAVAAQTALVARAGFLLGDFHAFYCAARVASQGADPYRTEPLRSCEITLGPQAFFKSNPGVTVPAPLPGYAIGALVPLSALRPAAAAAAWIVLLLLACVGSVLALSRFAALPWPVPTAAFALSLGAASLPFGEIVPIVIAAICASAYFAWLGRWTAAAVAAAVAMAEPHLGLPVCLSLAIWAPATRVTLAAAAVAFASISLIALGPAANLEYFTSVLPAHALSEAARDTQFSLTSVLVWLGASASIAIRAGSLWYAAMLAIGTVVAGWATTKTRNPAFLACMPPAFAVFGGTFVHVTQIAAALPAAILLLIYTNALRRSLTVIAVMLLSVPWIAAWSPALGLAPAFPIGYMAWRYWGGSLRAVLVAAVATCALLIGLNRALTLNQGHAPHIHAAPIDSGLAEASWSEFTSRSSSGSAGAWLVRIPTWAGLALLLGLAVAEAKAPRSRAARDGAIS